jgi:hypothetical protein
VPKTTTGPEGIRVTVTTGDAVPRNPETRYAKALRRKAANRARRQHGKSPLPELRPGSCGQCGGWGVVRPHNIVCPACGGEGE